jgi:uncharacterized protein (UPF0548 family)
MFLLSRPADSAIRTSLARQHSEDFSYVGVGKSRGQPPADYAVIHSRIDLGQGPATFARAVEALRRWEMFRVSGVRLCWPDASIEPGTVVAILIRHFGFWSLNFCRVVYVLDEDEPIRRWGFAYGTLRDHAEQGEERFTVEWDRASDVVSYDILSFSQPGHVVTRLAYPVARWLQRRFVRNSLAAMVAAVRADDVPVK